MLLDPCQSLKNEEYIFGCFINYTAAFSSYGRLTVMAVQLTAILLGHAQPFNNSCHAHESSAQCSIKQPKIYSSFFSD